MDFSAVRNAVRNTELYRYMGKIEKIIGMTIESSGPVCNIGDVCRIFKKGSDDYIFAEVVGFSNGREIGRAHV